MEPGKGFYSLSAILNERAVAILCVSCSKLEKLDLYRK